MTYARFTIDTNAFQFTQPDVHLGAGHSAFEHFLQFWLEYGIFVALNHIPLRETLPDDLRKKYDFVYKKVQHFSKRLEHSDMSFDAVIGALSTGDYSAIDNLNLHVIGILEGLYEEVRPSPKDLTFRVRAREEICRIRDLLLTDTRKKIERLRAADIPPEQTPANVWRDKLLPLFASTNLICVVDPYALANLLKEKDPHSAGLGFLINRIAQEHQNLGHVEIMTSFRSPKSKHEEEVARLLNFCGKAKLKNATILVADQATAEQVMHDRFIIGADHTIDVGRGLDILNAPPRKQSIAFSFKQMTDARAYTYHVLRNARRNMRSFSF
ncbi:MAG: hypothetical protein WDN03_03950 [Rhizomicrobium sp.]